MTRAGFALFFFIFPIICLCAQGQDPGNSPEVIRGEIYVDLEPIYGQHIDPEYPLNIPTASRRALEEAALLYSAMIYGWSFHYDVGEKARKIDEKMELEPAGEIRFGDPGLRAAAVEVRDSLLWVSIDYYLTGAQQRRVSAWRTGTIRNAQAIGYGPVGSMEEFPGWLAVKQEALEDAARSALRAMLRGGERNRPKEVTGFISLASFPRYFIESGRWAAAARFRVQISEIVPFAAY